METVTHLEVKSDSLIYLINGPEEPPHYIHSADGVKRYSESFNYPDPKKEYEKDLKQYESALVSCERILCADQEQAKELCWRNDRSINNPMPFLFWKENKMKPGIYSIPNVEWERVNYCTASDCPGCPHKCLRPQWKAELKESTPSTEQESQEELFDELFSIYFVRLHEGLSMYDAVKEMETRFTITRKK